MDEVNNNPDRKYKDQYLRDAGLDPNRVRRWFKKNHGMTFQAYLRALRIGQAFGRIKYGESVTHTAFDSGYDSLSGFSDTFKKSTGFSPSKSVSENIITVTRILTPLGPMLAGATNTGICLLEFIDRRMLERQLSIISKRLKATILPGSNRYFDELNIQISEYFDGKRKNFSVPIELIGSEFQIKVWNVLLKIPYGSTLSYQQVAKKLDAPKALRPVANANGANRIGIIIPCHRVIGADGNLTGYGGGLWRKKYLLDLESGNQN
jgi:AraC family transcriptional regulator of adaptative response/methylated-DNA-[protein]-cysteine methyltransferase